MSSVFLSLSALAQNNQASTRSQQGTVTAAPESSSSNSPTTAVQTTATINEQPSSAIPPPPGYTNTLIIDYKSVYETPTAEEEVLAATERFTLTPDQQDIWLLAAKDRREGERQFKEKADSKTASYEMDGAYRGYRTSQNTFYETIIGHLSPSQRSSFERDRLIIEERDKRLARWPMERPAASSTVQTTTVTVVPTTFGQDSATVKPNQKDKPANKKATKKKKG